MATFSERLKYLRDRAGLTQQELADRLNMTHGAIGNYESGKRMPRYEMLEAFADTFNCDLDFLLGKTDKQPEYSLEELWIINCYKRADSDTQEAVKLMLRRFDEKNTAFKAG